VPRLPISPLRRLAVPAALAFGLLSHPLHPALADDQERFTILEEDDSLPFYSDKHYTQGARGDYLGPDVKAGSAWNQPFDWLAAIGPAFRPLAGEHVSRKYSIEFGQNIYTPKNPHLDPPDPKDQPYAGWTYFGVNLLQDNGGRNLDHVGIQAGVVGPVALGEPIQNDFHSLIGVGKFHGWSRQIQNEPGLVLSYDRHWRMPLVGDGQDGVDIVPEAGGTIGNVYDYAEISSIIRFGHNLEVDYGPERINPGISGTDYVDTQYSDGNWGYYVFAGLGGRAVAKDIFLDGNNFRHSASVGHKTFVGDIQAGVALYQSAGWRVEISATRQTQDFPGQHGQDVVGAGALTYTW
jgi:hypothetical protein